MTDPTADQPAPAPRAEIQVDLDAVRHNVRLLAELAGRSGAALMSVVKADGYGHGAVPVARAALAAGATWLGVASAEEALRLRAAGITARLLCWLHAPDQDFADVLRADVDVSVSRLAELHAVAASARCVGRTARLHLKIDTGLSRSGCPAALWPELVAAAVEAEADGVIQVIGIWSHLACADELGHPSIDAQAARFDAAYQEARAAGLRPIRHLANSAATLTRPDLHFDLVRAGIAGYGLDPVPEHGAHGLRPAMTFRSSVVLVKRIAAGESVSYGHTWTATEPTTLALVPVGYGDGVPRALSGGRLEALVRGVRRPIAGRVCMDQIVLNCGDAEIGPGGVDVGDEVLLFGPGRRGEQTAREWADRLGTIDYEIVTSMVRPRLTRVYLGATPAGPSEPPASGRPARESGSEREIGAAG